MVPSDIKIGKFICQIKKGEIMTAKEYLFKLCLANPNFIINGIIIHSKKYGLYSCNNELDYNRFLKYHDIMEQDFMYARTCIDSYGNKKPVLICD